MKYRIMYIEPGGGLARDGGTIGKVTFSKTGKTLKYAGKNFQTLNGTTIYKEAINVRQLW